MARPTRLPVATRKKKPAPARLVPRRPGAGRRRAVPRRRLWPRLLLLAGLLLFLAGLAAAWSITRDVAALARAGPPVRAPEIVLVDRDGATFARIGAGWGEAVRLEDLPAHLPQAVLAIEDRRFFSHPGLDIVGILRALMRNILAGRVVEGGSTITQQLAKLAITGPERSLSRKLREALLAFWLEATLDKPRILEAYLNRVYLGAGTHGVDGAARHYFGRSAREVGLAEAAMLAGLIQAPSRLAPTRDLESAQRRAGVVLDAMVAAGLLGAEAAARAKAAPARLAAVPERGGHLADWVAGEVRRLAPAEAGDLVVATTLDRRMQWEAESAVEAVLAAAGAGGPGQAALVAMTRDGAIRAMVGGRSWRASPFNRATQARRQPGSAFKLFVYLAALEAGWRPEDEVSAAPVEIGGWRPRNEGDAYPERVSLEEAFARSYNTAAVRLAESVGRQRVVEVARRLGLTGELPPHPSLALGSVEASLIELTAAYASLAAGGRLVWPSGIARIASASGRVLHEVVPPGDRLLAPGVVADMVGMLAAVVARGTGRRAFPGRPAAGKTGTSQDNRDAWFIGFTEGLVVGVWVGHDDGRAMPGVSGGGAPAEIFRRFVEAAEAGRPARPLR